MRNGGGEEAGGGSKPATAAALRLPELALRLCAIPLALGSLWEMTANRQASEVYGEVSFSDLSGFRYLVGINAVAAAYSAASIFLSSCKSFAHYDWIIFILDQVVAYLLVTSAGAAAELLRLARRGDREVSWGEACSSLGRFCGKATVSLALHAAALACFAALALASAFPPPHLDADGDDEEPKRAEAEEQGRR